MNQSIDRGRGRDFERYRQYLRFLARTGLNPRLGARLDPSDIVQETLLEAHQARQSFENGTPEKEAAWLRRILARNLANAHRDHRREKRDFERERSLEASLEESSLRMGHWLAAVQSTPSERAMRQERALRLADAMATLPGDQYEALVLHRWHGWQIAEVAGHLGVSRFTVTRLLRRGVDSLRRRLQELE